MKEKGALMGKSRYLTAREAAETLGVSMPTLYAYVSRGFIRSEPDEGNKRVRRYLREDVQQLRERRELRRNPAKFMGKTLHQPHDFFVESAIPLVADGKLYYRGYEVVALATSRSVEEVAALIWLGDSDADAQALFDAAGKRGSPQCLAIGQHLFGLTLIELFQVALPVAAAEDVSAYDLRLPTAAQTGARILQLLTLIAASRNQRSAGLAQTLQEGWAPHDPHAARLLSAALILCADHELSVSTYTVRCAASGGATLYGAVIAGLAALQGVKHGGDIEQAEVFLNEVDVPQRAHTVITHRLKRGEQLPGFGHPLYPAGDPRGKALLELLTNAYPDSPTTALAHAVVAQVRRAIDQQPTIDFALAVLARVLNLPAGVALALFALGRTIGWIGHAIEQYQLDHFLRPRVEYVGPAPL